jgi:hypothetical protein
LYDAIMGHIEPELTSEGLKTLKVKYANETQGEWAARKQRYQLAAQRYDQAYAGYMSTLHTQVSRFCRSSYEQAEMVQDSTDDTLLAKFEQTFLKAT